MKSRDASPRRPRPRRALPPRRATLAVLVLICCYLLLSAATVGTAVLLRDQPGVVTDAVWVRASVVLATAVLDLSFVLAVLRGSGRAFTRLRAVTAVMVVVIAVLVLIPGFLPPWMRIEQAVCGLILIPVVVLLNAHLVRSRLAGTRT